MVEEAVDDAEEESKAWKTAEKCIYLLQLSLNIDNKCCKSPDILPYSDKSQMSKSELEKDWHKLVNISIF